ncbi:Copper-exporting P-type ATPase A [Anatilimnocola aggregata]|uniref:Copper-exporting P-type ATPase A n=1 Tax=Anatilimnocola aggregata TaxID=2528021 RepID=A0A517Y7S8_9BACT|nr:cation-translocating P-type ATPase [Anatilimnocola aggregata]QDU26202.1 Copper-exporting P-type ATPase A [Anatilimnocola aggregata]
MASIAGQVANDRAQCDFCELPITHGAATDEAGHQYCCYGCRFAASIAASSGDEAQSRWTMTKLGLSVFFSMNVMVCTLLLWSETSATNELASAWYGLFRSASLLFSLPVLLLLGPPIVKDARRELLAGRSSMSVLLIVGVAAAMGYSVYSVMFGGHIYCEVACAILLGVTLGKWLEANGKLQTTAALRAMSQLLPDTVRKWMNNVETIVPASDLQPGEWFRVLPGERIVADGIVQQGEALVDEQAVTGESAPAHKFGEALVYSGTLVLDGPLVIAATSAAGEGTIAKMIAAVKQGTASRSHYERLAERISRWFLPVVLMLALGTLAIHVSRGQFEQGLLAAVAVLVIACPCSLGLATPMALWAAIARAAQAGILIRSGDALTQFAAVKTICFDKTGTLTTGQPQLTAYNLAPGVSLSQVSAHVNDLVIDSTHPLAQSLADWCREEHSHQASFSGVTNSRHLPGRGVVGYSPELGTDVLLGNRRWLEACHQDCRELSLPADDATAETLVAWGGRVRAQFLFSEQLRSGVKNTLQQLAAEQLNLLMLTGDRDSRARHLATSLGLSYRAELLPEAKLLAIKSLSHSNGPVAMVGDGINDAPALATADVGISLAGGTDIARHSAPICLLRNDLSSLLFLRRLAITTRHALRWNLVWALGYNVIGLGLAAAGWLHPVIAAIAMGLSGLFVVTNSLALARFEAPRPVEDEEHPPLSIATEVSP